MRHPSRLGLAVTVLLAVGCADYEDLVAGAVARGAAPPVTSESAGGFEADDSWLFSDSAIHRIDITLPAASVTALTADPDTFAVGEVTIDGETVPRIGVRLRGKVGSFRTLDKKPKLKLDFNEYVKEQRFYGLKALALNNAVQDCSYLKEPLGYRIYAAAGVPALRTGFARLRVNGADYGLYIVLEVPDDRFLKRHYPEWKGNLYDGKYIWFGGGNYTMLDFNSNVDDKFALEEGTDVGNQDIRAVSQALAAQAGIGMFVAGMAPVLAWDEFHRLLAVDQWTGANDGYALNTNNYRVYFNPANGGRMEMHPYDLDNSFRHDYEWGMNWRTPRGKLARGCFNDTGCVQEHKKVVQAIIAAIDPAALITWFNRIDALTINDARSDPRRECTADRLVPLRQALRDWVNTENGQLRTFWGL